MRYPILFSLGLSAMACADSDPAKQASCMGCVTPDGGDAGALADAAGDAAQDAAADVGPDAMGDTGSDSADAAANCLAHAAGVVVADTADLDGYPPYSVHDCSMAYVSASGDLMLRDLQTGADSPVASAAEVPRRPSLSGGVLAWEAHVSGKSAIRVASVGNPGNALTITGTFDHAREPRATLDAVVFSGFSGATDDSDSDVYLYDVGAKSVKSLVTAKGQQRFADISATHVAWSDFSEDPSGVYSGDGISLADVVVYDRSSKKALSIPLPGKQAFPMLAVAGRVGFLDWVMVHPVPKLQDYRIRALPLNDLSAVPTEVASVQSEVAVRPSASATRVEWVVRWNAQSTLHRAALDGSAVPIVVMLGTVAEVHAPVGTNALSVVATRGSVGGAPTLQALAVP